MAKRIIDISLGIGPDLITWPGDPAAEVVAASRIAKGDSANVSQLRLGSHTGTHVDPPHHFVDGAATVDQLALEVLVGEAVVVELPIDKGPVGPSELETLGLPAGAVRLLLKSGNSALWHTPGATFPDDYVYLAPEGAQWIVERGIRLVGTDFLSIEKKGSPGHPTHTTLLTDGIVVVEGLDLYEVAPGPYELICLPLKILGGDGAPARAVLIER